MKILRAIGFGLAIIILMFLMPSVFHALEQTLLQFFSVLQMLLLKGESTLSAGVLLPQLPQIPDSSGFSQAVRTAW